MSNESMAILFEVGLERDKQDAHWGVQNHPVHRNPTFWVPQHGAKANEWKHVNSVRVSDSDEPKDRNCFWDGILLEEVYGALAETDPEKQRAELIQVAAVAVAIIEAIDRKALDDA